jgi:hypothetical protein
MKNKNGKFNRMSIATVSLILLIGIGSLAAAGQGRHAWNMDEKSKPASEQGSAVTPPAPVTDDTPIDPDARSKGKNSDSSRSHQSTNGHEKGKQRR